MLLVASVVMLFGEFPPIVLPTQVREQGLCLAFPLTPGKLLPAPPLPSDSPTLRGSWTEDR